MYWTGWAGSIWAGWTGWDGMDSIQYLSSSSMYDRDPFDDGDTFCSSLVGGVAESDKVTYRTVSNLPNQRKKRRSDTGIEGEREREYREIVYEHKMDWIWRENAKMGYKSNFELP